MSSLSEQSRSRAKTKAERLVRADPKTPVDASGYTPPGAMDGDVQTGPRPISRRQFKRGGKILGEVLKARADRKPRKTGGRALIDDFVNRDIKEANEKRDGSKHIGGMKKGGRVGKTMGGLALPSAFTPVSRAHGGSCGCSKCGGGRVGRAAGGKSVSDGAIEGARPKGGRLARKAGGRAKKGTNINIIIAPGAGGQKPPMPMPPPGAAGPIGLHQGAAPPPMPPAGAAPPMGPPPMGRKRGGRAYPLDAGGGGGLGRLEKIKAYG